VTNKSSSSSFVLALGVHGTHPRVSAAAHHDTRPAWSPPEGLPGPTFFCHHRVLRFGGESYLALYILPRRLSTKHDSLKAWAWAASKGSDSVKIRRPRPCRLPPLSSFCYLHICEFFKPQRVSIHSDVSPLRLPIRFMSSNRSIQFPQHVSRSPRWPNRRSHRCSVGADVSPSPQPLCPVCNSCIMLTPAVT